MAKNKLASKGARMPGIIGRSGRNKKSGTVYEFNFYYRFNPAEDPPELEKLLDSIIQAKGRKRRDIIRAALLEGSQQAQEVATQVENSEGSSLIGDMFDSFY